MQPTNPINAKSQNSSINKTTITTNYLGVVLDAQHPSISSPNGTYVLSLGTTGNIVLWGGKPAL
jgi:hypothetical protein